MPYSNRCKICGEKVDLGNCRILKYMGYICRGCDNKFGDKVTSVYENPVWILFGNPLLKKVVTNLWCEMIRVCKKELRRGNIEEKMPHVFDE